MSSTMPCSSSGLCLCSAGTVSRRVLVRLGGGSISLRLRACGPRRPEAIPNSTFWPALSPSTPAGSADERTYTSSPSSCDRKPNPLSASYHLTLPVGTGLTCLSDGIPRMDNTRRVPPTQDAMWIQILLGWLSAKHPRFPGYSLGWRYHWRRNAPDLEHNLAAIWRPLDG